MSKPQMPNRQAELKPMEHELKCWPEYFEAVYNGTKPFEARKNDRGYKVGDTLWLREWEPIRNSYIGRECRRTITYILDNPAYCAPGVVILGLDRPTPPAQEGLVELVRVALNEPTWFLKDADEGEPGIEEILDDRRYELKVGDTLELTMGIYFPAKVKITKAFDAETLDAAEYQVESAIHKALRATLGASPERGRALAVEVSDLLGHEGREGAIFLAENANRESRGFDTGEMLNVLRGRLQRALDTFNATPSPQPSERPLPEGWLSKSEIEKWRKYLSHTVVEKKAFAQSNVLCDMALAALAQKEKT